jgi:hypothetical protein
MLLTAYWLGDDQCSSYPRYPDNTSLVGTGLGLELSLFKKAATIIAIAPMNNTGQASPMETVALIRELAKALSVAGLLILLDISAYSKMRRAKLSHPTREAIPTLLNNAKSPPIAAMTNKITPSGRLIIDREPINGACNIGRNVPKTRVIVPIRETFFFISVVF